MKKIVIVCDNCKKLTETIEDCKWKICVDVSGLEKHECIECQNIRRSSKARLKAIGHKLETS